MADSLRNLARDPDIRSRVERELLPLLKAVRDDRASQRDRWLRYYRLWSVSSSTPKGYKGRTHIQFPLGRRWIENWVRRVRRDLFPDTDWFAAQALHRDAEEHAPAVHALLRYFLTKHMRVTRQAGPWLRQLVTYGTSPVRVVWKKDERAQTVLRRAMDADGRLAGGRGVTRETIQVLDYLGPTFQPVDLFAFYVWPTTVADVDDAELSFEDLLVSRDRIRAMGRRALDPRDPRAGTLYEHTDRLFALYADHTDRPTSGDASTDKFQAAAIRLAEKGFTHPLDTQLPPSSRPLDLTECMWSVDLEGDGRHRYLITIGADEIVLRIQRQPFWHGGSLWLAGKFVEVLNEFYGRGLPEVFESLAYFVDDLGRQTGDALVWSTNPIAIIDPAAAILPDTFRMAPGAKWMGTPSGIRFTEPPQGPAQAGLSAVSAIMGLANDLVNPSPAGAAGSAARGRGRAQSTATGMQLLVSEGAVDIRDVDESVEDQVLEPLLARCFSLAQQFLDRELLLKITGADGATLIEKPIGPADLVGDFDFEWLASTSAQQATVRGAQLIQAIGIITKIPEQMLAQQNLTVDWKWLLRELFRTGLQIRGADKVIRDTVKEEATDWRIENSLFRDARAAEVRVSPKDEHLEHARGHDAILQDDDVPEAVKVEVLAHVHEHLMQMAAAAMAQEMQRVKQAQAAAGIDPHAPNGGAGGANGTGQNGVRLPPPVGPGRLPSTVGLDDVMRQMPRTPSA